MKKSSMVQLFDRDRFWGDLGWMSWPQKLTYKKSVGL
jgi:hypothetical protein